MEVVDLGLYEFDKKILDTLGSEFEEQGDWEIPSDWLLHCLYCVAYKGYVRLTLDDSADSWYIREFFKRTNGQYYDFLSLEVDGEYEYVVVEHDPAGYVYS